MISGLRLLIILFCVGLIRISLSQEPSRQIPHQPIRDIDPVSRQNEASNPPYKPNAHAYLRENQLKPIDEEPALPSIGCGASCRPAKCAQPTVDQGSVVIVSLMDGTLMGLDARNGGKELWSLQTANQPLLTGTLNEIQLSRGESMFRLIPSLDGNLYMYDEGMSGTLQAIPVSAESLLANSLRFGQDAVAGGRQTNTYGIDITTGTVHYSCSMENCERSPVNSHESPTLVVKRTVQTVRAVDAATGIEKWNVSVGEHQLMMASHKTHSSFESQDSCYDNNRKGLMPPKISYQINPPTGYIAAVDLEKNEIIWDTYMQFPIAQAWEGGGGEISELSLFDPTTVPSISFLSEVDQFQSNSVIHKDQNSLLYMGTYDNNLYVIPSTQERKKMKLLLAASNYNAAASGITDLSHSLNLDPSFARNPTNALVPQQPEKVFLPDTNQKYEFLAAAYGPSPSIEDGGCFENCPTCSSDEVHALISRQQEINDNMGWYLLKQPDPTRKPSKWPFWPSKHSKSTRLIDGRVHHPDLEWISWFYQCMALLMGSCGFLLAIIAKVFYFNRTEKPVETASKSNSVGTPDESSPVTSLSQTSLDTRSSFDETGQYVSRFLQDFEPVRRLGKGGFGIVFEAKNKLDDCSYAVKRISLSSSASSRERVMREVKALAKFDHPGIVRFYQSWLEFPPASWQLQTDQNILRKCGSIDESVEFNLEGTTDYSAATKPDYSDIPLKSPAVQTRPKNVSSLEDKTGASVKSATENSISDCDSATGEDSSMMESSISQQSPPKLQNINNNESLEIVFGANSDQPSSSNLNEGSSLIGQSKSSLIGQSKSPLIGSSPEGQNEDSGFVSKQTSLTRSFLYIQMQLCQERTLRHWLAIHHDYESRVEKEQLLDWFIQIVLAVEYVHDLGHIHRDLKPSNIFFAPNGAMKVGDFGLARQISEEDIKELPEELVQQRRGSLTNCVGTRLYMSPEQASGLTYTRKVDIFSLGLILLELLVPFQTEMERVNTLQSARALRFPKGFSEAHPKEEQLVRDMLDADPEKRPECSEIKELEVFRTIVDDRRGPVERRNRRTSSSQYRDSPNSLSARSSESSR